MKLKLLDLFSGIGGFSLGFEKTGGFETIAFCEKDKFCQKVLAKHWNNIKIYDEIRNLKGIQADVITGGFPCQSFSYSGKRKGSNDDRFLWHEMFRIIKEAKPKWIIGENVPGIAYLEKGLVLKQIISDLESEGYETVITNIPACSVNAWHKRERIWIIANSKHNGLHNKKRYATIESCNQSEEWLFIRDNWKKNKSEFCRINDELSSELDKDRNNRIKALGNAIVPEIAKQIGLAILEAENEQIYTR